MEFSAGVPRNIIYLMSDCQNNQKIPELHDALVSLGFCSMPFQRIDEKRLYLDASGIVLFDSKGKVRNFSPRGSGDNFAPEWGKSPSAPRYFIAVGLDINLDNAARQIAAWFSPERYRGQMRLGEMPWGGLPRPRRESIRSSDYRNTVRARRRDTGDCITVPPMGHLA
jgi:hypothetical protein